MRVKFANNKAEGLSEYVFLISIVVMALLSMNVYIKRGIQAKVKDLSDALISKEHVVSINPVKTITNSTSSSFTVKDEFKGGKISLHSQQNVFTSSKTIAYDPEKEIQGASYFVPGSEGTVTPPPYPNSNSNRDRR